MVEFFEFKLRDGDGRPGRTVWINPALVAAVEGGNDQSYSFVTLANGRACSVMGDHRSVARQLAWSPQ